MYGINEHGTIIRIADGASIPVDETNRDYQHYLAWVDNGNTAVSLVNLDAMQDAVKSAAEQRFMALAAKITGEPINALIIQEWQAKEQLVMKWVAAGKPNPTAINEYLLAYYEATGDPDKTPAQLMESWLVNATNWRNLNIAYITWRQGFRARIKTATTEADLAILRDGIEGELQTLLGIG
jgi:hypothetical protein